MNEITVFLLLRYIKKKILTPISNIYLPREKKIQSVFASHNVRLEMGFFNLY